MRAIRKHIHARPRCICVMLLAWLHLMMPLQAQAEATHTSHAFAVFGDIKYPPNFSAFDYVNPNAPKGGNLRQAAIGTFDTFNGYILKGSAAEGLGLITDSLLTSSADEIATAYGLVAESITLPESRQWVIFTLRSAARFHDGTPLTSEDVVFTFNTLLEKGHPQYRAVYRDVEKAEALDPTHVKFTFRDGNNRELPLLVGQLPILSKKYYETHDFTAANLDIPLGSGPYRIKEFSAGRSVTFERVPDYWAKNLAVHRGRYNFDTIQIDYYRDDTVAIEALKAGEYDFRKEYIAKTWANAYNIPHISDGRMTKETLVDGTPTGMQCFVFNLRHPDFQEQSVREALTLAYDFEWANKNLFFSAYARNNSYFANSPFASSDLPSAAEKKLLEPFVKNIPETIFTTPFILPTTDGSGNNRENLIKAARILDDAGYTLKEMKRINPHTHQPMEFEFLLTSPAFERVVAPYIRNLKKLGITARIRRIDTPELIKRQESFDFDVITYWFTQGSYPGNEQLSYWHSSKANVRGSRNIAGIQNKAVDAMVERIVTAKNKDDLITASRALDRILLNNYYVVPQWHSRTHRIIYWNRIARPKITPPYSLGVTDSWWATQ